MPQWGSDTSAHAELQGDRPAGCALNDRSERARRVPAPRQRQEGAAVGAARRLLGAHVLAHVLEDEGGLAEGREGAQRPARTVGAAEDLQVRLVRDRARVRVRVRVRVRGRSGFGFGFGFGF